MLGIIYIIMWAGILTALLISGCFCWLNEEQGKKAYYKKKKEKEKKRLERVCSRNSKVALFHWCNKFHHMKTIIQRLLIIKGNVYHKRSTTKCHGNRVLSWDKYISLWNILHKCFSHHNFHLVAEGWQQCFVLKLIIHCSSFLSVGLSTAIWGRKSWYYSLCSSSAQDQRQERIFPNLILEIIWLWGFQWEASLSCSTQKLNCSESSRSDH